MSRDIYWSRGNDTQLLSYVPGVDLDDRKMKNRINKQQGAKTKTQVSRVNVEKPALNSSGMDKTMQMQNSTSSKPHRASLKDLCPEDKQRVANLIHELAKAGEEKEASEMKLGEERKQFTLQLDELKADKARIEEEQKSVLAQFKQSQDLLVYYQKKIAEEQKEVTKDINKLLAETPFTKATLTESHSPIKQDDIASSHRESLDHDITVREVEEENSTQRSGKYSSNENRSYNDGVGMLGESYLPSENENTKMQHTERTSRNQRHQSNYVPPILSTNRKSPRSDYQLKNDKPSATRGNTHTFANSSTDDYIKDLTSAFEERIRTLSPNGRREALVRQKRELEVEQSHLQHLLSEQEDILKYRQNELKRRHREYADRMRHFRYFGRFPRANDDTDVPRSYNDDLSVSFGRVSLSDHRLPEYIPTRKPTTPVKKFNIDDVESFSMNYTSQDFPSYNKDEFLSRSPKSRITYSEPTSRSGHRPIYKSYDVQSGVDTTESSMLRNSMFERHSKPRSHSVRHSTLRSDTLPSIDLLGSRQSPIDLYGNSTRSQSDSQNVHHYGDSTRSQSDSQNVHHYGDSTRSQSDSQNVHHYGDSSRSQSDSQNVTSYRGDESEFRRSKNMTRATPQTTANEISGVSSSRNQLQLSGYNAEPITELDLISSNTSSRRPLHTTMNNISTLSDLVDTVDSDTMCTPNFKTRTPTWKRRSVSGDDTSHSMTFDPEDSDLLEDIFFIK